MRDSIGTEEITNTFGWKGEEVWIQHDIEELYRLLMEHLSEEFKSTSLQTILPALYGGKSGFIRTVDSCGVILKLVVPLG